MKSARKSLSAPVMLALALVIARAASPAGASAHRLASAGTPNLTSAPTSVAPADDDSGDDDGDEDGGDGSSGY